MVVDKQSQTDIAMLATAMSFCNFGAVFTGRIFITSTHHWLMSLICIYFLHVLATNSECEEKW